MKGGEDVAGYSKLTTESVNEKTRDIDKKSALEIARAINEEDKTVAFAVERALPEIAKGIETLAETIKNGGGVYYCGAGTSGRLGVLDASECVPTFGVSPETFVGLMAGGTAALYESHETAEDDLYSIADQLKERGFGKKDALVAISASGSANCVKGALMYAKQKGAKTLCVTCNPNSDLVPMCEIPIVAEVGPEVITGSTRMKAGTAQKMMLNMLSTGAMIRCGRVRGNYMAYMIPNNKKLADRAVRMITAKTGCARKRAEEELAKHGGRIYEAMDEIEKDGIEKIE